MISHVATSLSISHSQLQPHQIANNIRETPDFPVYCAFFSVSGPVYICIRPSIQLAVTCLLPTVYCSASKLCLLSGVLQQAGHWLVLESAEEYLYPVSLLIADIV